MAQIHCLRCMCTQMGTWPVSSNDHLVPMLLIHGSRPNWSTPLPSGPTPVCLTSCQQTTQGVTVVSVQCGCKYAVADWLRINSSASVLPDAFLGAVHCHKGWCVVNSSLDPRSCSPPTPLGPAKWLVESFANSPWEPKKGCRTDSMGFVALPQVRQGRASSA